MSKKITQPQKIRRSYLDRLSYIDVQEDVRRSVIRNHVGEWKGSDAEAFCDEIENYIDLRFKRRYADTVRAVAKVFYRADWNKPEEYEPTPEQQRKQNELNYRFIY